MNRKQTCPGCRTRRDETMSEEKQEGRVFFMLHSSSCILPKTWIAGFALVVAGVLATVGCYSTPVDTSEYARGPVPLRAPSPEKQGDACCYEDSLTGGQVFSMY